MDKETTTTSLADAVEFFLMHESNGKYHPMEEVVIAVQRKAIVDCARLAVNEIAGFMDESPVEYICQAYAVPFMMATGDVTADAFDPKSKYHTLVQYAAIGSLPPLEWKYDTVAVGVQFSDYSVGIFREAPDGYRHAMGMPAPFKLAWQGNILQRDTEPVELPLRILSTCMSMARICGSHIAGDFDPHNLRARQSNLAQFVDSMKKLGQCMFGEYNPAEHPFLF